VIPVYITGAFEAMPRTRRLPRPHPIRVIFGNPIPADIVHKLAQEPDAPQRIVTVLHDHVAALERAVEAPVSKTPEIV
jgi:long-chain acyl-CoA synthetase